MKFEIAVEIYCQDHHLPFIHPPLNSYSRLEDHYNILDNAGFARQGTAIYKRQINADDPCFPRFAKLSEI